MSKRPNEITTTVTVPAADDYIMLDGAIGGSTKILATKFAPIGLPVSAAFTAAYTVPATDNGKMRVHTEATARIVTIDSNANLALPIGFASTIFNLAGAGTVTLQITADTLILAGAGTTGTVTLLANNNMTFVKCTSTVWMVSGSSGLAAA